MLWKNLKGGLIPFFKTYPDAYLSTYMKRRKAIRNIGLGISAGLTLPTWLSACKEEDPGPEIKYDGTIAVIGAGAAGLYVADILQTKGLNVVLYEASNRVGGRVQSIRQFEDNPLNSDFPTELGAERILGTDSVWAKIVQQLKIPVVEYQNLSTDAYFLDGVFKTRAEAEADSDFIAAQNFFNNLKNYNGSNVSVQQAIQSAGLAPKTHRILNSWIGNKYGTSNDRLSALALAEGLNLITRNSSELTLSSNPMQDVLTSRYSNVVPKVQLRHVVKSIDYTGAKIMLTGEKIISDTASENFSVEADRVIVTVPVSVLKDGDITFTPALPAAKTTALSRMEMDTAIRVVLEFKQNFWGQEMANLYGGADVPEYLNAGVGRSDFNKTMSLTIHGPAAEQLSPLGSDMVPLILSELDSIFDGKASLNIRRDLDTDEIISVIRDWSQEPYIRGGVAYVKPGGTNNDRINLGTAVNDVLFFAGEATDSKGEFGTINGALLSAERVAQEVIDTIV